MKFHWGLKIALVYCGFVGLMLFMVYKSSQQKIDLVAPDYYEKELAYQGQIEKMQNTKALESKVEFELAGENLRIQFPQQVASGEILFFRPSDNTKDFAVPVQLDKLGNQLVPVSKFISGKYLMQVDWKSGGEEFYQEEALFIP